MLLNVAIFAWFGAVCPWWLFAHSPVIPLWRLIVLGILVLLFRRPPIVYLLHRFIPQIEQKRQALFVGFFGPIGVSAIFYIHICEEYLAEILGPNGEQRADARQLGEAVEVIVWFMVICSIVVHGMSIPLAKLGINIPRTFSRAVSDSPGSGMQSESTSFRAPPGGARSEYELRDRRGKGGIKKENISPPQALHRIGRPVNANGQDPLGSSTAPRPLGTLGSEATLAAAEAGVAGPGR